MNYFPLFLTGVLLLAWSPRSGAAPVAVSAITLNGAELASATVSGEVVPAGQLLPGSLTAFLGGSAIAVAAPDGNPPAVNTRQTLLGDLRLDTGIINPSASTTAATYTFSTPLVNRPGPDILVMKLNAATSTDALYIRINNITQNVTSGTWGNTGASVSGLTEYSAGTTPASLAALQAATLTADASGLARNVYAVALELTDFGIAAGATAASLTFGSTSSSALADPVLIMGITPPVTGGPVISEILAANADNIEDEDTDHSDWVEIYNGQAAAINLQGWKLSDDPLNPGKWTFPSLNLPAFGSTWVFATGKDRFTNLHAHTSFTLSKNGGSLMLTRPDNSTASTLAWGPQQDDVSFGISGSSQTLRFFETPTPGTINSGRQAEAGQADGPVFNLPSSVLTGATALTVSLPPTAPAAEGAVIRYTLNNTVPSESSPAAPASINVTSARTMTFRVFQPGRLPSLPVQRNFIFLGADLASNFSSSGSPFTSNLPIMVLDSFNVNVDATTNPGADRPYRLSQTAVYEVDPVTGKAVLGTNPTLLSRAATHVRGQSSSGYLQKPYALEFWKEHADDDQNTALLGFPADSDWVLQTLYTDKTFLRNHLMQQLMYEANGAGPGHRSRFVEVFFNQDGGTCTYADYRGVYLLMERINRGNNRLPIEKLNSEMTETARISGGYIFKKDKDPQESPITPPTVSGSPWNGLTYSIVEPDPPTTAQQTWLRNWISQADTAMMQSAFTNPASPYYSQKWVDWKSFIDKQIWMETCKESDSYVFSYYYYKDRGQPLKADIIWDVDRSLGNSNYASADTPFGWRWWTGGNGYAYFPRLFLDPEFTQAYWDRWWSLRQGLFSTERLMARINAAALQLTNGADPSTIVSNSPAAVQNPAARHFRKYPVLGVNSYGEAPVGQTFRNTYAKELDLLKGWLTARLNWIDEAAPLKAPVVLSTATGQPVYGGSVAAGHAWQLANPNTAGTVYYTLNGADPRQAGGTNDPSALTAATSRPGITPLLPAASTWKWLRPASQPAAAWKDPGFNDTAWGSGKAPLGYNKSGLGTNIAPTPPSYGSGTSEPSPSYFRTTFNASGITAWHTVRLEVQADDGAVIYLNGEEVGRVGYAWPPVPATFTTEASGVITDSRGETAFNTLSIPASKLVEGTNTLAVEVHEGLWAYLPGDWGSVPLNTYSDQRFDLRVNAVADVPAENPAGGTFTTPGLHVIRSRVKNGSTWSGLTEAAFLVQTIPAAADNLVISEIHYHPAPPTPAEITAGYTDEGVFEYLELRNIHPSSHLDLGNVQFTRGITFNFNDAVPESRYLAPGTSLLLVANPAAFASRLPAGHSPMIAGTYSGALSNSGENLTVLGATGTVIKDFAYDDNPPWPKDADGSGRSLVLIRPGANPDHSLPWSWTASASPHGTPGGDDSLPPPSDPGSDANGNGFPDLVDYAMGSSAALRTGVENLTPDGAEAGIYLTVRFPRRLDAGNVQLVPEMATDPAGPWSATGFTFMSWETASPDGTATVSWRSTLPLSGLGSRAFVRLRANP